MANNPTFQFLRSKTIYTSLATAKSELQSKLNSLAAGEPAVVYYKEDGKSALALFGVAGGSGTTSGTGVFYNTVAVDDLVSALGSQISGTAEDNISEELTLNALKNAIGQAQSATTLSSTDTALVVTTGNTGTSIDINYDDATVKNSGSSGKTFDNGDSVAVNTLYGADTIIEDSFKVLGGNVGQLTSGTEIKGGTTVIELLKKMLVKEADCTAVKPTCTLSSIGYTDTQEVGTKVSFTLSSTYTDGKFTGSTADYGKAYSVNAGCAQGTVTYKQGSTTLESTSVTDVPLAEGSNEWSCTSTYSASTVTPKKNNGDDSTVTIASGTTVASSKSITANYKFYLGETTAASVADIVLTGDGANVSHLTTGWTATAGDTTIASTWTSNGGSIFLLVKGTLKSFQDSLSKKSLIDNFTAATAKTIAIGGDSTASYNGYLWSITSGAKIEAINIVMTH